MILRQQYVFCYIHYILYEFICFHFITVSEEKLEFVMKLAGCLLPHPLSPQYMKDQANYGNVKGVMNTLSVLE